MKDVKITVLKLVEVAEIHAEYAKDMIPLVCGKCHVGDSYVSHEGAMPEKFCPGAWSGLKDKVANLAEGKNSPYVRIDGVAVHSCNDGLHPVIFKLERV